jgi:outer membrane protein OmpA-like peptidoglycan-associated protein
MNKLALFLIPALFSPTLILAADDVMAPASAPAPIGGGSGSTVAPESLAADTGDSPAAVASKSDAPLDQGDNNYYWQGTQLYNLGRLGEAFESFEKAIQRKQNSKESEAYLLQIRQEIVNNAKKRAEERSVLKYGDGAPETALNISYVQKGYTKVILQMKFLFNENSTSLKTGAVDVLNRLAEILDVKDRARVELIVLDELDDHPGVRDIDAERNLIVFSYLNFKRLNPAES